MADKKLPWGLKSEGIAPGSMKGISDHKLKAFNIGVMNSRKGMSKKEQEELRKKQEEEAAAQVYEEFVASFEDQGKSLNKAWVKGGVVNPDKSGGHSEKPEKPKLYKPQSKLAQLAATFSSVKEKKDEERERERARQYSKKQAEKKKSNLELFKEELRQIQEEREERHRLKRELGIVPEDSNSSRKSRFEPVDTPAIGSSLGLKPPEDFKNFNYDDAQTTNLYLGNINPKMTEQQLCEIFGKHGPLASVKVMWPRSDEERARGRNCGFVAFMNRKDGERALAALQGRMIQEFEMKLGWGKAVPIPPHPVYIPPAMLEMTMPPPPSGLPFNAQPRPTPNLLGGKYANIPPPEGHSSPQPLPSDPDELEKTLANAVVKVVIPTDRNLLHVIHRMIEFVVREGPMFEAMIMNRELTNPQYRFLFENQSPAHIYYRWKLFSILQGDSPFKWRTDDFKMFKGGSIWRPPPVSPYTQGMPEALANRQEPRKGALPDDKRDKLEDLLRELSPERIKIGDAMVWCLEHAESAEEIVECIAESLSISSTAIPKKISRLFLINDILHNCSAKVPNASFFRKFFEGKLPEIFSDMNTTYEKIEGRLQAENFKQKVMQCFRAWEDWAIYTNDYLIRLQNIFLGLVKLKAAEIEKSAPGQWKMVEYMGKDEDDLDGQPIGSEDVDGMPLDLDGIPLDGSALRQIKDDVDGQPMDDLDGMPLSDVDGIPLGRSGSPHRRRREMEKAPAFVPSKWETVDQSELEAQAMTTSKWDELDQGDTNPSRDSLEEDLDGKPMEDDYNSSDDDDDMTFDRSREGSQLSDSYNRQEMTEERRAKLREIEVKVMKYQDDLEAGRRSRKPNMTIHEQTQQYRAKLLHKEEEKAREKMKERERERRREDTRERVKEWERARERERERDDRDRRRRSSSSEGEFGEAGRRARDSNSPAPSPRLGSYRHRSPGSPPTAYRSGDSPRRPRHRSRSRSPVVRSKSTRRSRSPRSQVAGYAKRSRSRSKSPRHRHKHKKSKR